MKAFIFPGQGCQKQGMGKDLYDNFSIAKKLFEEANAVLGRNITDVMFYGTEEELMETKNTQPSVFIYEVILALTQSEIQPDVVAGHSLGEYAALVVNKTISFKQGLKLVLNRAIIGQKACEMHDTAMAAVIGLSDEVVERRIDEISKESGEPIYLANFNGPGQLVITGSKQGVKLACKQLKLEGAKRAVLLPIAGAFHSPFMIEAEKELGIHINETNFENPQTPICQCVDGNINNNVDVIRENLVKHITHSVNWTKMVHNLVKYGVTEFYEIGTDDTLQKIVKRMYPELHVTSILNTSIYKGVVKDFSIINVADQSS